MATRPDIDTARDPVEPLLEELIAELVANAGPDLKGGPQSEDPIAAALTEAAVLSLSQAVSEASEVERALLVGALASAVADALAPALASALAPELATALSNVAGPGRSPRPESVPPGSPGRPES
jgi:hypothetical protein